MQGNDIGMNSVTTKRYLLRGAQRDDLKVPNRSFGWGKLDIYNTLNKLRIF